MKIQSKSKQKGVTLIVAMIILVILMILGVSAMMSANTQSKLAGNMQFQAEAKIRAENALTVAETWLATTNPGGGLPINANNAAFTTPCNARPAGPLFGQSCIPDIAAITWTDADSIRVTPGDDTQRYLIEVIGVNLLPEGAGTSGGGVCENVNVFRISARGTNSRGAVRVVQDVFQVRNCA